jgi:hypothetical protein
VFSPSTTDKCKNEEAAGSDNIPAEILTLVSSNTAHMLLQLLQEIWQKERCLRSGKKE